MRMLKEKGYQWISEVGKLCTALALMGLVAAPLTQAQDTTEAAIEFVSEQQAISVQQATDNTNPDLLAEDELSPITTPDDNTHHVINPYLRKQLTHIQSIVSEKLAERRTLGDKIEIANEQDKVDLLRDANILTAQIKQLRDSLENLATGGADSNLFVDQSNQEEKNWREDVALIAQPVLESLKEITETPRQIKELNTLILKKEQEQQVSQLALDHLNLVYTNDVDEALKKSVMSINRKWHKRKSDADSAIEIARIQLRALEGDQPLHKAMYLGLKDFIKGRGLTLIMAIAAVLFVRFSVKLLMQAYRVLILDKKQADSQTRYRVAKYTLQTFTFFLTLIAVFIVFYQRHDVLLLGLLILCCVGLALSVRQLLPRYMLEARLLLNLGPLREGERVIYRGLPWRVESINMFTIFRNPELNGILRVPLAELTKLSSRPTHHDSWFPTAKGDVILTDSNELLEVISQNPDMVELRKRGGECIYYASNQFYTMAFSNLSRNATYGIRSSFGLDYDLQASSVLLVPRCLREHIRATLEQSNLKEYIKDIQVELEEAGSSSLLYWLFVTMDSRSAKSYQRIERLIQTACIEACSAEQWSIPYPHLSVVEKRQKNGILQQPEKTS